MKKPTKLGYCTTCNAKIWVFDVNGIPFKRRDNYCEVLMDLSDGSRGRLAFCRDCVDKGFCAEEAISNACAGVRADVKKKSWPARFKAWHLKGYKNLKIIGVHHARKLKSQGLRAILDDEFERLETHGEVRNLHDGPIVHRKWTKPPMPHEGMENIEEYLNGASNGNSSTPADPI